MKQNQVWFITGASKGFGLEITKAALKAGHKVVATVRSNPERLSSQLKTIVLADSSKFGKRGFGRICALDEVVQVITDSGISDHMRKSLTDMGIEVTIVA